MAKDMGGTCAEDQPVMPAFDVLQCVRSSLQHVFPAAGSLLSWGASTAP